MNGTQSKDEMTNVTLYWKPRLSRKRREMTSRWLARHYALVESNARLITIKVADRDTKFIWIFMLSHAFTEIV